MVIWTEKEKFKAMTFLGHFDTNSFSGSQNVFKGTVS
jgi:hypothetical protein